MLRIEGGKTVDVRRGVAEQSDWVVLASGLLATTEDAGAVAAADRCDRLVASGQYILPGLIDAHVHLGRPRERSAAGDPAPIAEHISQVADVTLRSGVTLVRDLGDRWPLGAKAAQLAIASGAPRVVSALSGLTTPQGYGRFLGEAVGSTDELLAAVCRRHQAGARVIKLFLTDGVDFASGTVGPPQFDREALALAAQAAHDRGLSVAVHANGSQAVMAAILAGADTIEHGILVDDDVLRAMAENGIYWIPTLTPLWRALQAAEGRLAEESGTMTASLRDVFERHQEAVAKGFDMGIKVIAGTDAGAPGVPHGLLNTELRLFAAAGVRAAMALKSATIWAAEALGLGKETGLIEPGRWSDLLILRRDPLQDGGALDEICLVILGGKSSPWRG